MCLWVAVYDADTFLCHFVHISILGYFSYVFSLNCSTFVMFGTVFQALSQSIMTVISHLKMWITRYCYIYNVITIV